MKAPAKLERCDGCELLDNEVRCLARALARCIYKVILADGEIQPEIKITVQNKIKVTP